MAQPKGTPRYSLRMAGRYGPFSVSDLQLCESPEVFRLMRLTTPGLSQDGWIARLKSTGSDYERSLSLGLM